MLPLAVIVPHDVTLAPTISPGGLFWMLVRLPPVMDQTSAAALPLRITSSGLTSAAVESSGNGDNGTKGFPPTPDAILIGAPPGCPGDGNVTPPPVPPPPMDVVP